MSPSQPERRDLLQTVAGLALAAQAVHAPAAAQTAGAAAGAPFVPDTSTPALPGPAMRSPPVATRTPGKAGDFDFLNGHWKIHNRRQRAGAEWDIFEGEASCWSILGGVCSIEELRIPARQFSGMGLRLLDVKQRVWSDFFVNAAFGLIGPSGMPGSFEDGAGIFEADDEDNGKPIKIRGVWDLITAQSCRWQQGVSRDGGRTWEVNWSMDWIKHG
ncbi:MAG: hypothetical protein ACKVQR_11075 [Aquabacterium sp.]